MQYQYTKTLRSPDANHLINRPESMKRKPSEWLAAVSKDIRNIPLAAGRRPVIVPMKSMTIRNDRPTCVYLPHIIVQKKLS